MWQGLSGFQGRCSNVLQRLWPKPVEQPDNSVYLLQWYVDENKSIPHVAIQVFKKTYEFTPDGIELGGRKKYNYELKPLGTTKKEKQDFESWVFSKDEVEFCKGKFNLKSRNSLHFAAAACEFLTGKFPEDVKSTQDYILRNLSEGQAIATLETYREKLLSFRSSNIFNS